MKLSDIFPSKYLKAADLDGDTVVMISGVSQETMKTQEGEEEVKPVLHFSDLKPMVLNLTNARAIESLYGDDLDGWTGNEITLYVAEVSAFGKTGPALRVRDAKWVAARKAKVAAPAPAANGSTDKPSAIKAWNEAAGRAKKLNMLDVVDSLRPAKDADAATILKAAHEVQYQADVFEGKNGFADDLA